MGSFNLLYVGQCQRFFHQHEMSKTKMKNVPLSCSIPHMHPSLDNLIIDITNRYYFSSFSENCSESHPGVWCFINNSSHQKRRENFVSYIFDGFMRLKIFICSPSFTIMKSFISSKTKVSSIKHLKVVWAWKLLSFNFY